MKGLSTLNGTLTCEKMRERIAQLEKENQASFVKLQDLRAGTRKVDPVEKAKVDKQHSEYTKEWKLRKKMVVRVLI